MQNNRLIIYSLIIAVGFIVVASILTNQGQLSFGFFEAWRIYLIIFFIILFFAIRGIMLWYWKVNKAIELLDKIERNTRKDKI